MKNILILGLGALSLAAGEEAKTQSADERVAELEARVAKLEETVKRLSESKSLSSPDSTEPKGTHTEVDSSDITSSTPGREPSQDVGDRYRAMSDEAREKLRQRFMKEREDLLKMTPEQRAAFIRRIREEVEAEEAKSMKEAK